MLSGIGLRVSIRTMEKFTPNTQSPPGSLVSGPLTQTSAFVAKVSTTPRSPGPNYQHVICVYLPNVFDKDEVTKVRHIGLSTLGRSKTIVFSGDESPSA